MTNKEKMKLAYMSDVHLEFSQIDFDLPDADVMLLCGDIFVAQYLHPRRIDKDAQKHQSVVREFFLRLIDKGYSRIYFVPGNHEFYHGCLEEIEENLIRWLIALVPELDGVLFLLDGKMSFTLNDEYSITGCTLWTNMNKENPTSVAAIHQSLNDYRVIYGDKKRKGSITPYMTIERHYEQVKLLKDRISEAERDNKKLIIMTHHAPTFKSIAEDFKDDHDLNGAYASDLSTLICYNDPIRFWFHGHIHDSNDYEACQCRVLSNPRGYVVKGWVDTRENKSFAPQLTVSL